MLIEEGGTLAVCVSVLVYRYMREYSSSPEFMQLPGSRLMLSWPAEEGPKAWGLKPDGEENTAEELVGSPMGHA